MGQRTPLYDWHLTRGAKMVDFGGWDMPVVYTSIVDEHRATRHAVGLFDISHMGRFLVEGEDAVEFLDRVLTNRVATMSPGQVRYSLVLNEAGGILDDILVYRLFAPNRYLLVVNASNRLNLIPWFLSHAAHRSVGVVDQTHRSAMIAIQGPSALGLVEPHLSQPVSAMASYTCIEARWNGNDVLLSRTGYTGEDGFEIVGSPEVLVDAWKKIIAKGGELGAVPAGLGARDTLRLEAGMPLYGHELSADIDPIQAGLAWAVKSTEKDFVGKEALARRPADRPVRVGLALEGRRIARQDFVVLKESAAIGTITSGTFSPTLERSIAMAYINPNDRQPGMRVAVDVRGSEVPAIVERLPFYRRRKASNASGRDY